MRTSRARSRTLLSLAAVLALACAAAPMAARAAGKDETREAVRTFKAAMKSKDASARLAAVAGLAAVEGDAVEKELRKVVTGDRDDRVRAVAARALGRRGHPKTLPFLVSALRSLKKRPVALAAAVDGIGGFRDPKTAKAVFEVGRTWIRKHRQPAIAAIRALGRIPSADSVEYLLKLFDLT